MKTILIIFLIGIYIIIGYVLLECVFPYFINLLPYEVVNSLFDEDEYIGEENESNLKNGFFLLFWPVIIVVYTVILLISLLYYIITKIFK